jgi:MFS transporter, ACDE family, multidrug resistance protein
VREINTGKTIETRKATIFVILACSTLTVMAGATIGPIINAMREALNATPYSIGFIVTAHALFITLTSPVVGNLVDRIGRRPVLLGGLLLYGLAGGAGVFISSYTLMLLSRAFLGIGVAAIVTPIATIIADLYLGRQRATVMGYRASANSFGGVVFPLVGGALGVFSWNLPFAVYFVAILLAVAVWFTVPETLPSKGKTSQKNRSIPGMLREAPVLSFVYLLGFLAMVFLYVVVIFVPQRLGQLGISNTFHIALFLTAVSLSAGFVSLMYGWFRSVLSYPRILMAAFGFWAIGFALASLAASPAVLAASLILIGVGMGLTIPTLMVWVTELVDISYRGRAVGYLTTFSFLGQFASPLIFAPVVIKLGIAGVFLTASEIGVAVVLLVLFLSLADKLQDKSH